MHVKILGVIGGGSRVSIKGGSFTFVSSFLQISAELAIVGASLMEVVGVSCSASTTVTSGVTSASFISAVAPIIVSNRSTFSISHIAIGAFSANIQTELSLSLLNATSAIDIFGSSTLSIDTATIEMQHVVAKGNLGVYVMYTSSSIAVSNNSTLSIHNSSAEVDDVIVSGTFSSAMVMMMAIGSFTISYGSSMSLSCASLGVRGVSVTQSWPLYVMCVYSTLIMSNSSTLSISNITVLLNEGTARNNWGCFVLRTDLNATVSNHSALSIINTTIGITNISCKAVVTGLYVVYAKSLIAISNGSALYIHNSAVTTNNVSVGGWPLHVLFTSSSITVLSGCSLVITGVAAHVQRSPIAPESTVLTGAIVVDGLVALEEVVVVGVSSKWVNAASLSGTGQWNIGRTQSTGGGDMVSTPSMLANGTPRFYVCQNYVNGIACTLTASGSYWCATDISQFVELCSPTSTTSNTLTVLNSQTDTASDTISALSSQTKDISNTSITTASQAVSPSSPTISATATRSLTMTGSLRTETDTFSVASAGSATTPISSSGWINSSASHSLYASTRSSATPVHETWTPSEYVTASLRVTPSIPLDCPLTQDSSCPYTTFAKAGPHTNTTSATGGCNYLEVSITFSEWSGGNPVNISVLLAAMLSDFYVPISASPASYIETDGLVAFTQRITLDNDGLWMDIQLRYVGAATRGSWSVMVNLILLDREFSCRLPAPQVTIPLSIFLEAAPPIPDAAEKAVDTLAVAGAVSPTGLVRGGMLSSLLGMMRCSEFDPDASLSFINNPFGWAIGTSGPRYQRGSAVIVMIVLCAMGASASAGVGALVIAHGEEGVGAAVGRLRLPSCTLPTVLLLAEVGVSGDSSAVQH